MKYKAELTAQLREEYGINKVVQAPVQTAVNNPIPPAPSNFDLSTIKTEPFIAKDLANPSKKSVPIKRKMEPIYSITSPQKRVASAVEFRDLMTPKKSKTNLKTNFVHLNLLRAQKTERIQHLIYQTKTISVPSPM